MSKADGQKILLKFTQALQGDVTGLTPNPIGGIVENTLVQFNLIETTSTSNYGSGAKAIFDGSTSTYDGTTKATPYYYKLGIKSASTLIKRLSKLRIYNGSSYRVNAFSLEGSNDDSTWTTIFSGNCTAATRWNEFTFDSVAYTYYRLTIESGYTSSRTYLYEFELYGNLHKGNESAFTISGKEYQYVEGPGKNGPLVDVVYPVVKVERVDTETIRLVINEYSRFENVVGKLQLAYSGGNLRGNGGNVVPFSLEFLPEDLIRKPDIGTSERISIYDIEAVGSLILITTIPTSLKEYIHLSDITATGSLIKIDDI